MWNLSMVKQSENGYELCMDNRTPKAYFFLNENRVHIFEDFHEPFMLSDIKRNSKLIAHYNHHNYIHIF